MQVGYYKTYIYIYIEFATVILLIIRRTYNTHMSVRNVIVMLRRRYQFKLKLRTYIQYLFYCICTYTYVYIRFISIRFMIIFLIQEDKFISFNIL